MISAEKLLRYCAGKLSNETGFSEIFQPSGVVVRTPIGATDAVEIVSARHPQGFQLVMSCSPCLLTSFIEQRTLSFIRFIDRNFPEMAILEGASERFEPGQGCAVYLKGSLQESSEYVELRCSSDIPASCARQAQWDEMQTLRMKARLHLECAVPRGRGRRMVTGFHRFVLTLPAESPALVFECQALDSQQVILRRTEHVLDGQSEPGGKAGTVHLGDVMVPVSQMDELKSREKICLTLSRPLKGVLLAEGRSHGRWHIETSDGESLLLRCLSGTKCKDAGNYEAECSNTICL